MCSLPTLYTIHTILFSTGHSGSSSKGKAGGSKEESSKSKSKQGKK